MDYEEKLKKFNIDKFIDRVKDKNFIDLFNYCQKEFKWLEGIKFTKNSPFKDVEWLVRIYKDFIHEFCFFLTTGIKPFGMKDDDFQLTKPVIENLIARGEWKKEVLNIYKK